MQLTVAKLKPWLQDRGLDATGKKADLVATVESHFESKR